MKSDNDFVLGPCRCETCANENGEDPILHCGI